MEEKLVIVVFGEGFQWTNLGLFWKPVFSSMFCLQ